MTRHLDNIAMPVWACNQAARILLEQIIREQPEPRTRNHRLPDIYGGYPDGTSITYRGRVAGQLRQMHDTWLTDELAALDAHPYDREANTALFRTEDANALIARVLAETAELAPRVELPSELKRTGTGGYWS